MKAVYRYFLMVVVIVSVGCRKYVDIRTNGQLVPLETQNYRYTMNNSTLFDVGNGYVDFSSDDVDFADEQQQQDVATFTPVNNYYTWAEQLYDASTEDYFWSKMYNVIFNANVVITEVLQSTNGTEEDKRQIYGEALVNRADAYLQLARSYGKAYDAATAAADLAVPLLLTPSLDTALPRASLQTVYAQIISDLKTAVPVIAPLSKYNTLASRAAAYALLARSYLDMGDYDNATEYADSTLEIQSNILDLNTIAGVMPRSIDNPELIFSKTANLSTAYSPALLRVSDELLTLFDASDLRYTNFFSPAEDQSFGYTGKLYNVDIFLSYPYARNCGPTVPEMMLIKAECSARKGDADGALQLVNSLREKRFAPADYAPLTASNAGAALQIVLDERRRELCCRGFRWYDLKRLNKEAQFARTITRTFNGEPLTLAPNSNRYVFPIAAYYFTFNKQLVQNPR